MYNNSCENIADVFFLTLPKGQAFVVYFTGILHGISGKWPYICCSIRCSILDLFKISLNSSHLSFSLNVLIESMWCNHTVVQTELPLFFFNKT